MIDPELVESTPEPATSSSESDNKMQWSTEEVAGPSGIRGRGRRGRG